MALWTTGELVTASKLNTNTGPVYSVAQADVTASRAIDGTVYHNTSGKIILVTIEATLIVVKYSTTSVNGTASIGFYCDAAASPTTLVNQSFLQLLITGLSAGSNGQTMQSPSVTFFVPSGYYYKALATSSGDASAPGLGKWFEWTLF